MKNILVVFTGGTIGSTALAGTIDAADTAPFKLIDLFQQYDKNYQQIRFSTIEPLQLLSENLVPCVWQTLITAIEAQQPEHYDGIIITHGTDTLAYTAAALSFYFNAIKIPLLLVSSDYPLDNPKANGLDNFMCAVEFIRQKIQVGVFVPYRNQQQALQVHKGSRLTCSLQLSGDFFSVQGKSFMHYENRIFSQLNPVIKLISGKDSSFSEGEASKEATTVTENPQLKACFSERILMIKPYPGLNYHHFNLENVDAVLHDLYHSGTACASMQWGKNYSLLEFIKRCGEQKIKVYLAPAIKSADAYQSTRALIEQGAEMIWNMSIEAAYVKLMLAYGNFTDEQQIMAFINEDIAGEHV
ncbi:asparaginase [Methylobacter sp. S3L5C]|uniref:asparaginase n=1 Tax=Methylobacter sp. S3L5C TaxID=2839024 RepID=UPI001FAE1C50|nr:asparaginase domain-containing protein [Methylobacter sp. S3L5C]UOA09444.1 asparaginase [Methylobacter sp. S3L5C]